MKTTTTKLTLVKSSLHRLSDAALGDVHGGTISTHLAITAMAGGNGGLLGAHKPDGLIPVKF